MRWFPLALLSLFGCKEKMKPYTILIAGQSNAVAGALAPTDIGISKTKKVSVVFDGKETVPTEKEPITHSLTWIRLGDMIAERTGRDVRIVNVASGATTSDQWAEELKGRIPDALIRYRPDVVLWIQGESDTDKNFSSEHVYENLRKIANQAGNVPFYCALDGYFHRTGEEPKKGFEIRAAQERLIREGRAQLGVDVDALRVPGVVAEDKMHFTGPGFETFARMWFEVLTVK